MQRPWHPEDIEFERRLRIRYIENNNVYELRAGIEELVRRRELRAVIGWWKVVAYTWDNFDEYRWRLALWEKAFLPQRKRRVLQSMCVLGTDRQGEL